MGGRGSSSGGTGGGTTISVPEGKRRRGSGNRRKKIKTEPGFPIGTNPPRQPTGGAQGNEGQ